MLIPLLNNQLEAESLLIYTIGPVYATTGLTLYAIVDGAGGVGGTVSTVFNPTGGVFEILDTNARSQYAVSLTEIPAGQGKYYGILPTALSSRRAYPVTVYTQAGGSPAASDVINKTLLVGPALANVTAIDDGTPNEYGATLVALIGASSLTNPLASTVPGAFSPGTAGYLLGTNLDAAISSRAAEASGNVPAIRAKTDLLLAGVVGVQTDLRAIDNDASVATTLRRSLATALVITVTGVPTVTSVPFADLAALALDDNALNGRILIFVGNVTPQLKGEARKITASEADGTLTLENLTRVPAIGDLGVVV